MISVVFAVIFFCLAIATAVYAGEFADFRNDRADKVRNDLAAVSVSFLTFFVPCVDVQ